MLAHLPQPKICTASIHGGKRNEGLHAANAQTAEGKTSTGLQAEFKRGAVLRDLEMWDGSEEWWGCTPQIWELVNQLPSSKHSVSSHRKAHLSNLPRARHLFPPAAYAKTHQPQLDGRAIRAQGRANCLELASIALVAQDSPPRFGPRRPYSLDRRIYLWRGRVNITTGALHVPLVHLASVMRHLRIASRRGGLIINRLLSVSLDRISTFSIFSDLVLIFFDLGRLFLRLRPSACSLQASLPLHLDVLPLRARS